MIREHFFIKIFILLFIVCLNSHANEFAKIIQTIDSQQIYLDKEWLNLVHYKKNILSGFTSEADGEKFFFSKDGKHSPREELIATLESIFSKKSYKDLNQHPYCLFPARTHYISNKFKSLKKKLPQLKCNKYIHFQKKLNAQSASIVFSSYYTDTPASAFGHTLLRIGKTSHDTKKKYELLDHGINYSASVTTNNAFLYGLFGLTGGFKGEFAALPYFYKIREYNDHEARDIWEYQLNLTKKELKQLVAHIWEMGTTYFDYYYLTENCSYHLLGLLDAINPHFELTNKLPTFVIPVDTIRAVVETPGLLRKINFRPSSERKLRARLKGLSKVEFKAFKKTINKNTLTHIKKLNQQFSPKQTANILDTIIDYYDYKYSGEILLSEGSLQETKNDILVARSQLSVDSKYIVIPIPLNERPEIGHLSRRVSLSAGNASKSGAYNSLEYRFSFHELSDIPVGQNPYANLEMGRFRLRYNKHIRYQNKTSKFWLDEATLLNIVSLSPMEELFKAFSWKAYLGGDTIQDQSCLNCFSPKIELGGGLTQNFGPLTYFLLMDTTVRYSNKFKGSNSKIGFGPELNILLRPHNKLSLLLTGNYRYFFLNKLHNIYDYQASMNYHFTKDFSLKMNFKKFKREAQTDLGIQLYF